MKGVRISLWMIAINVGLVLLVAAGLIPGAVLMLRRFAADGASARVQLAAAGAVEGLRLEAEEVLTAARLLAERPTLNRLVGEGSSDELRAFLARFRTTSHLDGCAVLSGVDVVAADPSEVPWAEIAAMDGVGGVRGVRGVESGAGEPAAAVAAGAPLQQVQATSVVAFRWLGESVEQALAGQVGLPIAILCGEGGESGVTRGEDGAWRARRFFAGAPGGTVGVEVLLPASEQAGLRAMERSFALVSFGALLAAIVAGVLAARRVSTPLTRLQAAAEGIGAGDFSTPVPAVQALEARGLAATMEDMRRRLRRATAELQHREAEARALLDGVVEGVVAVDANRRIEYLNPQASRFLGIASDQAVGRFCGDVLRPVPQDGARPCEDSCPIVHARSRGSSRSVEHLDLVQGPRTMVITSAPPAGGRQVLLLRDETEVEAARRSRDAVFANVSHELKTPLSAQMASIQLLEEALGDEAPLQVLDLVESLERSTLRLSRLIDNLLESVRIETGHATVRSVPVDLRSILVEAEAMTHPLLRQRKQEVVLDLAESLAPVVGDPTQLTQVFVNLLANANKFSPEGSQIRIGGKSDGAMTTVWVEDAGPGIPPSERLAVFDHYYRADPGGAEGMGLGLWIVKSIVERHSGSVEVAASELGGARFTVRLPRAELAASAGCGERAGREERAERAERAEQR